MSRKNKNSRSSPWPLIVIGVGLLMLITAVGLLLTNPQRDSTPTPTAARFLPAEETYPEIPRVNLADAKAALDAGTAVFVDVRDAGSFARSHIEGARSLPLAELDKRMGELTPTDWIITYCT